MDSTTLRSQSLSYMILKGKRKNTHSKKIFCFITFESPFLTKDLEKSRTGALFSVCEAQWRPRVGASHEDFMSYSTTTSCSGPQHWGRFGKSLLLTRFLWCVQHTGETHALSCLVPALCFALWRCVQLMTISMAVCFLWRKLAKCAVNHLTSATDGTRVA